MEFYSVKEVAEKLNVNQETVRRWIRSNRLAATKKSNKGGNIILEKDLEAFIENNPQYAPGVAQILSKSASIISAIMKLTLETGTKLKSHVAGNYDLIKENNELMDEIKKIDEDLDNMNKILNELNEKLENFNRMQS